MRVDVVASINKHLPGPTMPSMCDGGQVSRARATHLRRQKHVTQKISKSTQIESAAPALLPITP
jgi:hypothetical protein